MGLSVFFFDPLLDRELPGSDFLPHPIAVNHISPTRGPHLFSYRKVLDCFHVLYSPVLIIQYYGDSGLCDWLFLFCIFVRRQTMLPSLSFIKRLTLFLSKYLLNAWLECCQFKHDMKMNTFSILNFSFFLNILFYNCYFLVVGSILPLFLFCFVLRTMVLAYVSTSKLIYEWI